MHSVELVLKCTPYTTQPGLPGLDLSAERIGAIVEAFRRIFARLRGTAPTITADTAAKGGRDQEM